MREKLKEFFRKEGIEYHAALAYTDVRETSPEIMARENFTPQSVIVFLLPYYVGKTVNISNYAASLDYHIIIKDMTAKLRDFILSEFPYANCRGYGDHSPIDERHAALVSSLGILGDNGLLINEKYGSYVFIADLVTDISPEKLGAVKPSEVSKCLHCGKCRTACPTGILSGRGSDCLSAITQKKGELTDVEITLIRRVGTVWGCDICQNVCPYNQDLKVTPIEFFHRKRIVNLTSLILSSMTKEEFGERAFAWRGRKTVERNLLVFEE